MLTEIAHDQAGRNGHAVSDRIVQSCGVVNRVSPVLAPEPAGASTLVAMAVPKARLQSVAATVIGYRGVKHLCERQHEFNLWFALAASNAGELYDTVGEIRKRTGVKVLDLRPERRYRGDLQFPPLPRTSSRRCCPTTQADTRKQRLLREGVVERRGRVLGAHVPSPDAKALVVFDVPRHQVDMVGERLAQAEWVDLCYRCVQRAPVWPYNLYCTLYDDRDLASLIGWVDKEVFGIVRCPKRALLLGRARFSAK